MKGRALIIKANSLMEWANFDGPVPPGWINKAVGGHIEVVPQFERIKIGGEWRGCVAFCNEDGKLRALPTNGMATSLWATALDMPLEKLMRRDVLVGPVVILFGDKAFLDSL